MLHMSEQSSNNSLDVLPYCFLSRQTINFEAFFQW